MSHGKKWFLRGFALGFASFSVVAACLLVSEILDPHSDGSIFVFVLSLPSSLFFSRVPDVLHDSIGASYELSGFLGSIIYALVGAIQWGVILGACASIVHVVLALLLRSRR